MKVVETGSMAAVRRLDCTRARQQANSRIGTHFRCAAAGSIHPQAQPDTLRRRILPARAAHPGSRRRGR